MRRFSKREVAEFYRRLEATRPIPQTELEFINPFTLLVAVVLSAQSRILVEQHGGVVPRDREALEKLPGVGRKTANVVLNVAFGEPTIAVDTHIFRVANRTGLAPGKTPREVEAGLEAVTPARYKHGAHHWLILHGRYVCKARKPEGAVCIVADLCPP